MGCGVSTPSAVAGGEGSHSHGTPNDDPPALPIGLMAIAGPHRPASHEREKSTSTSSISSGFPESVSVSPRHHTRPIVITARRPEIERSTDDSSLSRDSALLAGGANPLVIGHNAHRVPLNTVGYPSPSPTFGSSLSSPLLMSAVGADSTVSESIGSSVDRRDLSFVSDCDSVASM